MPPISLTSSDLSNTKLAPLDRAKQLAATLLSERSEASGALVARQLDEVLRALDASDRHGFQRYLAMESQPDRAARRAAAERYLADGTAEAAAALARAADPPRQELLRRINMAPGGTSALMAMRGEIASWLRGEPELKLLDADLKHLFASWFNRGFLELRRMDWQTPAAVLEKLIAYEAVHEIKGWDDLRRRLAPDRRCFGFFHPALPGEPLIFVEVALTTGLSSSVQPLLAHDDDEGAERERERTADTAIFYSLSNCQDGLRGVSFGNFLIKQVVEELKVELPRVMHFSTLSPVPGYSRWLKKRLAAGEAAELLLEGELSALRQAVKETAPERDAITLLRGLLETERWWEDAALADALRDPLTRLCAVYLTTSPDSRGPADSVARFHLGNGARLERVNWLGNVAAPRAREVSR